MLSNVLVLALAGVASAVPQVVGGGSAAPTTATTTTTMTATSYASGTTPYSSYSASSYYPSNGTVTSTNYKVVSAYTTYCPEPTVFEFNNKKYTVTAPTTLTITDCPCTVYETPTNKPVGPTSPASPPANTPRPPSSPPANSPAPPANNPAPPPANSPAPPPAATRVPVSGAVEGRQQGQYGVALLAAVAGMLAL